MPVDRGKHDKQAVLRQHATLNPRPGGVTHALFQGGEFFDPHDLLQVKYEMLRLVNRRQAPDQRGGQGLRLLPPVVLPGPDRLRARRLGRPDARTSRARTAATSSLRRCCEFVVQARAADPQLRAAQRWPSSVRQRFGVQVHPRSIERQLAAQKKTALSCPARPAGTVSRTPRNDGLIARYEDLRRPGARAAWCARPGPGAVHAPVAWRHGCRPGASAPASGAAVPPPAAPTSAPGNDICPVQLHSGCGDVPGQHGFGRPPGGYAHDQRSPPEGSGQPPQAQRLPVRAPVDAAPGAREHREHQAPVRAAPARGGAGLGRGAHHRDRQRPRPVRRLVATAKASSVWWPRSAWATPASCWAWRSRGWRATRWTGTGCWRSAR